MQHSKLRPDKPALIGVSGGRDSVVLLHILVSQGWRKLVVCHLNHGLRGRESGQDAAFVRRLAKKHRLSCEVHRVDIASLAKTHKLSTETCARNERDAFFQRMARKHGTRFVFLAHHAEDQAETVLANLCRGAGMHGLGGMEASANGARELLKLRPLLEVRRRQIDAYLDAHSLAFREDASNASLEHRRNRLRHEVIPLLAEIAQRDVTELIARCAGLLRRDEAFLREAALRFAEQERVGQEDGALRISAGFKALHPAVQSRVLRHWLRGVLKVPEVGFHVVEGALGLLAGGAVARMNLPGGWCLRRKAGWLRVEVVRKGRT